MREPGGEAGPDGDRDRKHGEKCGDHMVIPTDHRLHQRRQQ